MSEYRIKNIQPYEGNSVIIDMKDTRTSIAVYGKDDIECLEYALHFLKNKEKCTQPIQFNPYDHINEEVMTVKEAKRMIDEMFEKRQREDKERVQKIAQNLINGIRM